jgi:hypothetical protein
MGSAGTSRKLITHGTETFKRLANETDRSNERFNARSTNCNSSLVGQFN